MNVHVGVLSFVIAGGSDVIVGASGWTRSRLNTRVLSAPVLPAASVARTRNV